MNPSSSHFRIFCVEDNALLVVYLQSMIEDAGYVFAGSAARFDDVKTQFDQTPFDLALVDIDLADGRTGGEVAIWLKERGRPSLFVTGQEQVAAAYAHASVGTIVKPVKEGQLRQVLASLEAKLCR